MIRQLDHVVLVVLNLDGAVAEHRGRGFTVTPGGEHAGGLTHNALIGFQDGSYLELIAFHDVESARGKHQWAPVAERGGGWADFALLSDDLATDAAALGTLVTQAPMECGRTRPDGVHVGWRSARLAAPLPFLIEDITPRNLRAPGGDAARHRNRTHGVERVIVGATDPTTAAKNYQALSARGAPAIEVLKAQRDGLSLVLFR